jgi:thymidylate synthase (FAD)
MSTFTVKLVSTTKTEKDFIDDILASYSGSEREELEDVLQREEGLLTYCARVSSPNQDNPRYEGLLKYCMKHGHWSVFEMADMTVEIVTSRGISPQILRHRSFSFQEFSQRYAAVGDSGLIVYEARRQDDKNRQNSIDDVSEEDRQWFRDAQQQVWDLSYSFYEEALSKGIAKECARFLLPLNTKTKLYMKGSIRSWLHYIDLRCKNGTQLEHAEIAEAIKDIFSKKFPTLYKAKEWS